MDNLPMKNRPNPRAKQADMLVPPAVVEMRKRQLARKMLLGELAAKHAREIEEQERKIAEAAAAEKRRIARKASDKARAERKAIEDHENERAWLVGKVERLKSELTAIEARKPYGIGSAIVVGLLVALCIGVAIAARFFYVKAAPSGPWLGLVIIVIAVGWPFIWLIHGWVVDVFRPWRNRAADADQKRDDITTASENLADFLANEAAIG